MKRLLAACFAALSLAPIAGPAAPNVASTAFTRAANSPAGRQALTLSIAVTPQAETWHLTGQDVVPFYYEQGMVSSDRGELFFSSRNSLTQTTRGCEDALGTAGCYDVVEERMPVIPRDQALQGFNHIGGIDVGAFGDGTAPGAGLLFAPLETDTPRSRRGYAAYGAGGSFPLLGLIVEEVPHRYNSWVAVDPTAQFMITAEDGFAPIRVYEIQRIDENTPPVQFVRRPDLDIFASPAGLPNMQGCKFADPTTLYCSNWAKRNSYFDVRTEVYRVDLSAPIGTPGATVAWTLAFSLKAQPKFGVTANTPYGLETEDLAFWGGQMHIQLRGEALGWVHIVHLGLG